MSDADTSYYQEGNVVHSVHAGLRLMFTLLPLAAGVDKFTNWFTQWEHYLNPLILRVVPVSAPMFMRAVGVLEIVAGVLVFVRPRVGGFVVAGWLMAIALQLFVGGMYIDIALRDAVLALGGALTLARLTPIATPTSISEL